MAAAPSARHIAFARFVKRACDHAKLTRDWNITDIAEKAGLSRTTLYAWLKGTGRRDPLPVHVVAFCDALDIPVAEAFRILWPSRGDPAVVPAPLPPAPDFEVLMRRLEDPNVPETEKFLIRETVRGLAARRVDRREAVRRQAE